MAYHKGYRKGGSGGKLGHSNISHWDESSIIKLHAKKVKRLEERILQLKEKTKKKTWFYLLQF